MQHVVSSKNYAWIKKLQNKKIKKYYLKPLTAITGSSDGLVLRRKNHISIVLGIV